MKVYGQLEVAQLEWFTEGTKPAAASYPQRIIWTTDTKKVQVSDGVSWNFESATGIETWDSVTVYAIGDIVTNGTGAVYVSLQNANLNNLLTDAAFWQYSFDADNTGHNYLTGGTIQTQLDNTDTVLSRQPTVQKFTASSGTYTTPANVKYIRVRMAGAGGGGAGGKFGAGVSNNGIDGSASTFGTSLLTANGGQGGQNGSGGTGGSVTVNAPAINTCSFSGGAGNQGDNSSGGDLTYKLGGAGGSNCFGGAGVAVIAANGTVGASNTGAGGGGGSGSQNTANGGGGGGSGGYIDAIITSPSATYLYSVGLGGTGGANDTNGGAGASGIIVVEEYYV